MTIYWKYEGFVKVREGNIMHETWIWVCPVCGFEKRTPYGTQNAPKEICPKCGKNGVRH